MFNNLLLIVFTYFMNVKYYPCSYFSFLAPITLSAG